MARIDGILIGSPAVQQWQQLFSQQNIGKGARTEPAHSHWKGRARGAGATWKQRQKRTRRDPQRGTRGHPGNL
ncbi:hypothetical protein ACOMHN_024922 [Nucella lapillus]